MLLKSIGRTPLYYEDQDSFRFFVVVVVVVVVFFFFNPGGEENLVRNGISRG